MNGSEYVNEYERLSVEYLKKFNNIQHWFSSIERQPVRSAIDFICVDREGRSIALEIKVRHCSVNTYNEIFLNPEKYRALMAAADNGYIPLYLNFMQDDKHFVLWDMRTVIPSEGKTYSKIPNAAREQYDRNITKLGVAPRDGHYYEYDDTLKIYVRRW